MKINLKDMISKLNSSNALPFRFKKGQPEVASSETQESAGLEDPVPYKLEPDWVDPEDFMTRVRRNGL